MELIVVTLLCIVIVVALLKGVNITITHKYPEVEPMSDNLYDKEGDPTEKTEDYLQGFLSELHDLMEGDDVKG